MNELVKLIWAFWIIAIAGVVLAIVIANPFLLIIAGVFLIASIVIAVDNHYENKKITAGENEKIELANQNTANAENLTHQEILNDENPLGYNMDTKIDDEISKTAPDDISASKTIPEYSQDSVGYSLPSVKLEGFDMLTGVQFKDLIERHFKKNGYLVNRISPRINSIDFLVDKNGITAAVATRLTFDLISRSYIAKVIESAKMYEGVTTTMIITNSFGCVLQAQQLANNHGIIVWDREVLKSQLGGLK